MKVKSYIKSIVPKWIWKRLHNMRSYKDFRSYRVGYRVAEKKVRKKQGPLNVLFFVIWESQWKCDSVFLHMLNDENFNPMIIVCNIVDRGGRDYMLRTMRQCGRYFEQKGYPYVYAYDENMDSYIDPMQYNPDIIFYTNPYWSAVDKRFFRDSYKNVLSCYVNYFYVTNNKPWSCADTFHKSLWRYYLEYPLLQKQSNDFWAPFKLNSRVVGYPLFDVFRQYKVTDKDWPIEGKRKKRIIWAPHHTISGFTEVNAFATFERYYDFMLQLADKYKDEIQIVFKPHPALKTHLYDTETWGKERTDAYYEKWATGENTAFEDGGYVGLFLASDAMIHDCNSFTVEYLVVNKPAMFLDNGQTDDKLNAVAVDARACYYQGLCENDIENFIKDVVIGGKDNMEQKRADFIKNNILPLNGKLAAENIIDDLLTSLGRK